MGRIERWVFPRPAVRWAVVVSAAVLLTLCLNGMIAIPAVSYVAYLYSTWALVIFCAWLPGAFRRSKSGVIRRLDRFSENHPRFVEVCGLVRDVERRTRALLAPSLVLNLGYAAFELAVGIAIGSDWMIGIGAYYAVLAGLRFALLKTFLAGGADAEREWRAYRNTAGQLLLLTLAMTGLIVQAVYFGRAYSYPGILIYAFALYAFVKIIAAVFALLRHRHGENRLLAASRCVSFATALMSMLALQTAMLHQFGGGEAFARTINTLFGAAVCLAMLAVCGAMLNRYKRHHRQMGGDAHV